MPHPESLPLSFAQTRLWFVEQLFPGRSTYHLPQFWGLTGEVDPAALRTALARTAERHEALRTSFGDEDGQPRALVHDAVELDFVQEELTGEAELRRYLARTAAEPFVLTAAPPWRVRLVRTGPRRHVLAVVFHHIISDGWSIGIFTRELSHHYRRAVTGTGSELPEPAIGFGDFAVWQRDWLQGEQLDRQLGYWKEQLRGCPDLLALPTDRPRPPVASNRGSLHGLFVPRELARQVEELGRREQVTPFMVLTAAFSVLLYRYSGEPDVVVGTPIANRHHPDVEGVFGFFANTLALRTRITPGATFREVLAQVKATALDAYDHQDLPIELIVDELGVSRDLSRHPIFQVMFAMLAEGRSTLGVGRTGLRLGEAEVRGLHTVTDAAKFDLTLLAEETAGGLHLEFEYATDLFTEATVDRMARHLQRLLAEVADDPGRRVEAYPLEADDQVAARVAALSGAGLAHDRDRRLHEYVERFADRTPDVVALRDRDGAVTYRDLNAAANRLARRLLAEGVGRNEIVGLAFPRSRDLVVAMVAVLKAGAAYLALDPASPPARLRSLLADAGAGTVLADPGGREALAEYPGRMVLVGAAGEVPGATAGDAFGADAVDLGLAGDAGELAYLVYTSGSTGTPKGVTITHRNVTRLFPDPDPLYRFGTDEVWTLFHSCAFDLSVWEIWGALSHGATLSVVPADVARSADEFTAWLADHRVTVLSQTPSAYAQLLTVLESPSRPEGLCVRTVILGGEAWGESLLDRHQRVLPEAGLYNEYGPAEGAVWTTHCRIYDERTGSRLPMHLGVPHSGSLVVVLTVGDQVAPPGVLGEICIGGEGVTAGYWRRPDLNTERFATVELPGVGVVRLYRTGDLGRYQGEGYVEFAGRKDHQVKIRGYRVEPGEVETVLRAQSGVREAVVVPTADGMQLAGYVVSPDAGPTLEDDLRAALGRVLPDYMVPVCLVRLDAFPITPNGKVDRPALPAPRAPRPAVYTAPSCPAETAVAEVFAELLGSGPVSADADFFTSGGHSLLATQAAARISQRLSVPCPVRYLFQYRTPRLLAAQLTSVLPAPRPDSGPSVPPLPVLVPDPENRTEPFPLTDVQEAYWIGRTGAVVLGGVSVHCYIEYDVPAGTGPDGAGSTLDVLRPDVLRLDVLRLDVLRLDVLRLERALNRLVARHEAMRLVVDEDGRQRVLDSVPEYRIVVDDLRGLDDGTAERALEATRDRMAHQVLPAGEWPLFEVRVSRRATVDRLHLSLDALTLDAWSLNLILDEWARLYQGGPDLHRDGGLLPLTVSFRDYVLAEKAFEQTDAYGRAREYWTARAEQLPGAPRLPLVAGRDRVTGQRFDRVVRRLDRHTTDRLRRLADDHGIALSCVLAAVFADVLAGWSSDRHFTLNLTLFNRLPVHPQINAVAGDFTSLNLLEVDWRPADVPFAERARGLQDQLWADLDHRFYSGVRVLRELARSRGADQGALMPVVFTCLLGAGGEGQPSAWEALFPDEVYNITQTPQVWLDYQVYESQGELVICWDHVAGLFPDGLVPAMHAAYLAGLERLAGADADAWQESRLTGPPPVQLRRRAEVNRTGWTEPDLLMHQLFERRAEQAPDALAVIDVAGGHSYRQIEIAANRLARRLARLGLEPNDRVGVLAGKGWRQVVACLGVQKAGAAYLPVDASAPPERIGTVLRLGGVRALVVQDTLAAAPTGVGYGAKPGDAPLVVLGPDVLTPPEAGEDVSAPAPAQGLDDLAYVIFTSGSTGTPKGVMIDHRGAVNTLLDVNDRFRVGPGDRAVMLSSLSFDLSVYDIFGLLAAGGAVVIPPAEQVREPAEWAAWLVRHGVTVWNTVPMFMQMLVEAALVLPAADRAALGATLRLVMLSGDWIPVELPARIRALFGREDLRVISLGGATEASIWSIAYEIDGDTTGLPSVPYGRPLRNQTFHVLDGELRPCPDHVPGHLYIGGIGVALGYLGDGARSAESFVRNLHTGERLYRTGDLGRYLPSDDIEFLGRVDLQVKIGGHRIELGEIEHHLGACGWVRHGLAQVVRPDCGNPQLAAYLVPETGEPEVAAVDDDVVDRDRTAAGADPVATVQFKLAGHGLRETAGPRLPVGTAPDLAATRRSGTYRTFHGDPGRLAGLDAWLTGALLPPTGPVPIAWPAHWTVAEALAPLLAVPGEGPLPAYRYGSAGSLYPVQTYLVTGGTYGPSAGVYYLDPVRHELACLAGPDLARPWLAERRMPLALCLVAKDSAIGPVYGPRGRLYATVEAGSMAELVGSATRPAGIGWRQLAGGAAELGDLAPILEDGPGCRPVALLTPVAGPDVVSGEPGLPPGMDVLLHVKPRTARGPAEGWHRWTGQEFVPATGPDPEPDASNRANWSMYQNAAAALYVTCRPEADRTAAALFAGRLVQALRQGGPARGLGGCAVGELDAAAAGAVREAGGGETVLGFYCGPVSPEQLEQAGGSDAETFDHVAERVLRARLERALPPYMVPDHYVVLDRLPLSANGKVDRAQLPEPRPAPVEPDRSGDPHADSARPWTGTERVVAGIWRDLLDREPAPRDDFFVLGGHSLTATQLSGRLRAAFGVDVPLRAVFANTSVAAQARVVEQLLAEYGRLEESILPRPVTCRVIASPAQQRLWYVEQLAGTGSVYAMPAATEIGGALDVAALRAAIAAVIDRHDILRTTFELADGELWQVVHDDLPISFVAERCSGADERARREHAAERLRRFAREPFDLAAGPLLRFCLLALADDRHILASSIHHTVSDGWSAGLIQEELSAYYNAALVGRGGPELDQPTLRYADYAAWQRDRLGGKDTEEQLRYWHRHLDGAPGLLALPTDFPRPERQSFRGAVVRRPLDPDTAAGIAERCHDWGVTPYVVYLAAFQALLFRLTGEPDVVVGTPAANRRHPGLERLVGFVANTLAVRIRCDGAGTFAEHVRTVREVVLQANEHQDAPFDLVADRLQGPGSKARTPAYQPIFQAMLVFENEARADLDLAGTRSHALELDTGVARFDLTLLVQGGPAGPQLAFEYATDLFRPETVEGWLEALAGVLGAIVAGDGKLGELPVPQAVPAVADQDGARLGRGPRRKIPAGSLHGRFERIVVEHGGRCAVRTPDTEVSYHELNARANRLARLLLERGVTAGDVVALCLNRSPDLIASYLAVLKTGAAYVAVDPEHPDSRICHLVADTGAMLVVTDGGLDARLAPGTPVLALPAYEARLAATDPSDLRLDAPADALAYVIYTSGSTGEPKGARVRHRGLLNLVAAQREWFEVEPGMRVLQFASCGFDGAVWEWATALLNGAELSLVAATAAEVVDRLHRSGPELGIHAAALPPSVLAGLPDDRLPDLRVLLVSGESCPQHVVDRWSRRTRLINAYGPCEATVTTTMHEYRPGDAAAVIGRPVANTDVHILDEYLRPAPPGVPGELCVAGVNLAEGYHGREDETARRFVELRLDGESVRVYRTGDRARWTPSGEAEFLGRFDDQVKIRGIRVEPGEVRSALLAVPGVVDAAVVTDHDGDVSRLLGYFVAQRGRGAGPGAPEEEQVRDALRAVLPEALVPSWLRRLDRLPVTLNGKLDSAALPRPPAAGGGVTVSATVPAALAEATDTERWLLKLVAEVLDGRQLGRNADFFRSGGNSLKAIQLVAEVRRELGVDVEVRTVFDNPTVAALARAIETEGTP